jgi:fibronectin-binding autotransporter adhesin
MNQAYRVVWNASSGILQVVSELARAKGKTSGKAIVAVGLLVCGVLVPEAEVYAQVSLLVGTGGSGGNDGAGGLGNGGAGGLGGGGGGGLGVSGTGGGGGGFGGGGGGSGAFFITDNFIGGNGGGSAGGSGDTTGNGGGGDSGGAIGGNGSSGIGSNAGSGTGVGTITTATSPDTISTGSGQSNSYSYVGVGGGGGGGGSGGAGSNGGSGTAGYLAVAGSGVGLTLTSGMLVGGGGGGGAEGGSEGGSGGSGGAGTVTISSDATLSAATLQVGAGGGGGSSNGGAGGAGGTGALSINSGATLSATTLLVGGDGGGGGVVTSGGAGGTGTVTVSGNSTVNVTRTLVLGGYAGTSGTSGSGEAGAGGTGTFNLGGGSTLNLTGASFTINSNGTFNLGDATVNDSTGGAITGLGSLVNNGQINFNQTDTSTISADISGSGGVSQNGRGTTILTGDNTYTGGTSIAAGGTLQIGNGGTGASLAGSITDNGTLAFDHSDNVTFSDVISGSGSLTHSGTGSLTLSGINSYTGGTTVTSGTLQIGNGDASGSISGSVTNNGALSFNRSDNVAFSGSISGNGSVEQSGGTLTLSGSNTYSGSTTINGGATLALSGTGSVANSSMANSGTLDISGTTGTSIQSLSGSGKVTLGSQTLTLSNANGTFSGVISGSGGFTIGSGTETLTNVNTYTGTTTIDNAATLILSSANDITLGNVVNDGNLEIVGAIGALSGTGTVSVGSAGLTVTGSGSFGGVIAGAGGLTLSGSNQTLSGTNTYTGVTTIDSDSTLLLSGTGSIAQSSSVTDEGTFDISNTTAGATIQNLSGTGSVKLGSQTLTLSNAIGTFSGTFSGSGTLLKQGSGTLILDGISSSFTGTTEVNAGLLEVGDVNTPSAELGGDVIVDSATTLRGHGTVDGDVTNNGTVAPGGTIGTLTVGGNYAQTSSATLSIEVSPTAASELKVNGTAMLNGVLAITYDPGTYTAKQYTLVSASGVSGRFSSITGTGTSYLGTLTPSVSYDADSVQLTLAGAGSTTSVVVAPTDTGIYTAIGTAAILGAQSQDAALLNRLGNATPATPGKPNGWITATGSQATVGGTDGAPAFQSDRYGFLAGLDQKLGDYTVGVAAGYDHADVDEQNTGDSGTTDTLRAAIYGARRVGPVNLAATFGAGLDFLSQKRPFGSEGTAEGDHMGQEFHLGGQASLPMALASLTITPRVGLRYAYFHANGFDESGAGGKDLDVGTDNAHSLQSYAEVTLDKAFGDALKPVNVELRLGYAHELLDANRTMSVASQDGTEFAAPGTNLPRGYLTTGASVTLRPKKNMDVSLNYDTVINTGHVSAQAGSIKVGYQF